LQSALGSVYQWSYAQAVFSDGATAYVVGAAYYGQTASTEAILWTVPVPEPGIYALSFALGLLGFAIRRKCTARQSRALL
jgi:hypothetical protein